MSLYTECNEKHTSHSSEYSPSFLLFQIFLHRIISIYVCRGTFGIHGFETNHQQTLYHIEPLNHDDITSPVDRDTFVEQVYIVTNKSYLLSNLLTFNFIYSCPNSMLFTWIQNLSPVMEHVVSLWNAV